MTSDSATYNSEQYDSTKYSQIFKALSNKTRLEIYLEVLNNEGAEIHGCALQDFIDHFNIGAPTISHHIKELVNANLITVEKNGKFMTCFLDQDTRKLVSNLFS